MASTWRWLLPAFVALQATGILVLSDGGPAQAHPFGDPQTVELAAEEAMVRVRWTAAPDDLGLLAMELHVLSEHRTLVFPDGALMPEESDPTDVAALVVAPELADYLLDHVAVEVAGRPCEGSAEVSVVEVSVPTLTDIHPAYRTLATGEDGQRHVYTTEDVAAEWTFAAETDSPGADGTAASGESLGRSSLVQMSAVPAVVLAAGGAGLLWQRCRGRTARPDPPARAAAASLIRPRASSRVGGTRAPHASQSVPTKHQEKLP